MKLELQTLLCRLSDATAIGSRRQAVQVLETMLQPLGAAERLSGGLALRLAGKRRRTILFDAHLDEIGMGVTAVGADGFLRVAPVGGVDAGVLPGQPVTIWGEEPLPGVFCSTPPHLQKDREKKPVSFDDLRIDTGLGERAAALVRPGDYVSFEQTAAALQAGVVTGKALDNRAGVAALLLCAASLCGQTPPCDVVFLFSDQEELGCRGAATAAFGFSPDEAVVVDVSFGNSPGVPEHKTGVLGGGVMLGRSPVLHEPIYQALERLCQKQNIPYVQEAMGGRTGTNADVISTSGRGVACGLVSIPLRSMHTPAETVALCDIEAAARLLTAYALAGGAEYA